MKYKLKNLLGTRKSPRLRRRNKRSQGQVRVGKLLIPPGKSVVFDEGTYLRHKQVIDAYVKEGVLAPTANTPEARARFKELLQTPVKVPEVKAEPTPEPAPKAEPKVEPKVEMKPRAESKPEVKTEVVVPATEDKKAEEPKVEAPEEKSPSAKETAEPTKAAPKTSKPAAPKRASRAKRTSRAKKAE